MARRISPSQLRSTLRQAESKLRSAHSRFEAQVRRAQAQHRAALARLRLIETRLHSDLRRLRDELSSLAASGAKAVVIPRSEWAEVPYEIQNEIRTVAANQGLDLEIED